MITNIEELKDLPLNSEHDVNIDIIDKYNNTSHIEGKIVVEEYQPFKLGCQNCILYGICESIDYVNTLCFHINREDDREVIFVKR